MPNSGSGPSKEGGAGGSPATESRPRRQEEGREGEGRQLLYRGEYVVVRKRGDFLNAYPINNPDMAPAELVAYALKELLEKRDEIKVEGIIWLAGSGFRLGVPPDGRVLVTPIYGRKVILLPNIIKFVKHIEKMGLKLE